jgi:hypothetical protein
MEHQTWNMKHGTCANTLEYTIKHAKPGAEGAAGRFWGSNPPGNPGNPCKNKHKDGNVRNIKNVKSKSG